MLALNKNKNVDAIKMFMLGKSIRNKTALIQFYGAEIKKIAWSVCDALRYGRTSETRHPRVIPPAPGFLRDNTDNLIPTYLYSLICWAPCQVRGRTPHLWPILPTTDYRPSCYLLCLPQMVPVLPNTIVRVVWSMTFSCYLLLSKNVGMFSKQVKCFRGGFVFRKSQLSVMS